MTINVHFPLLLEMPERELSNVIAMQKKHVFFLCSWKTKKLCFCCCVWIVFAKFNFFLGSRRPFSYVFMNFTLLWGCVRSVLVFRSFCAVCGICIFHCLVGAWREVRFSLFITVTWNPLKTKGLESALWHKKSRFYRMFLKSGKHSSSSNISHFINIHRFLHSKYVAISWYFRLIFKTVRWTSSTLPRVTTITGMPKTPPQNGPW